MITNDVYMGPTVREAAETLIRRNKQKIEELQQEIAAARGRMDLPHANTMLEAERIATRADIFLPSINS